MADKRAGRDLELRFARFAGQTVVAEGELPDTRAWRHIRDQLLRSGTAPGAHYSEALGAQSNRDFIHKLSLALKEQRESVYWVRVTVEAKHAPTNASYLLDEGDQLVASLSASVRTAKKNRNERDRNES